MDIKEVRDNLLDTLTDIDKDKLSLPELKLYAEILKTISEVQVKSFSEYIADMQSGMACTFNAPKVSEMKGDK